MEAQNDSTTLVQAGVAAAVLGAAAVALTDLPQVVARPQLRLPLRLHPRHSVRS